MKIILSYGMGRDSTAILLRWLTDPTSRDFDLADLIVVTAQVGNEWPDTYRLVEAVVLPLLRKHKVRYVQLARKGPNLADGIVVLDDSREPTKLYTDVPWTLRDELVRNGTVPESGGNRKCSIKYKGTVIDRWVAEELGGTIKNGAMVGIEPYRHVIGFNADELERRDRDQCYGSGGRHAEYPLIEWRLGHSGVAAYCHLAAGVAWPKSACHFCPFSRGKEEVRDRIALFPDRGIDVLMLEYVSMALNGNMKLYGNESAYDAFLADPRLDGVRAGFQARLDAVDWCVYRVRRAMIDGVWDRSVEILFTGPRGDAEDALLDAADERDGLPVTDAYGIARVPLRDRQGDRKELAAAVREAKAARARAKARKAAKGPPRRAEDVKAAQAEEFLVLAPAGVEAKARGRFEGQWRLALAVLDGQACPA